MGEEFQLYDLRVEVVCPADKRIMCGAKEGISIYSLTSVLPLLAAKQCMTLAHDWMTTDSLIACPDPHCPSQLRILRTGVRTFKHSETTVVTLKHDS